ncbi:MAG: acetate kinase, partial [Pseudolabrys sp.]
MDTILVVNAGSSSVKFQVFEIGGPSRLKRLIKGQVEGIGTRPRLRAQAADNAILIDQTYGPDAVSDVPSAIREAGSWLRTSQKLNLIAVGHRVVHGGPAYSRPTLIDSKVIENLERYIPLAPLHQPNNLAPIRSLIKNSPELPQVACFDTAFH